MLTAVSELAVDDPGCHRTYRPCAHCSSRATGRFAVIIDDVPIPVCQRCAFVANRLGKPVLVKGRYLMREYRQRSRAA